MKRDDRKRVESQRQRAALRKQREAEQEKRLAAVVERQRKSDAALAERGRPKPIDPIFQPVVRICPRVADHLAADPRFRSALSSLLGLRHVRQLQDWAPQGKSAIALFRSLGNHLLAKYRVSPFLWSGFFDCANSAIFIPMIDRLAKGESLYTYVKNKNLSVPLTRKMCHEFLKSSVDQSVIQAMRRAQVIGLGGEARLSAALSATVWGREIQDSASEEFWSSVVQWFANQDMLDPSQVAPMCDYVLHRRRENESFSLKGRTALSMMRAMEEWHAELNKTKVGSFNLFKPSGIRNAEFDFSRTDKNDGTRKEIWRVTEILNAKDLAAEGRRQSHCVFSYAYSVEKGSCSIWTLTREDNSGNWAMLTVEVRNQTRAVVQARGRFNRLPTTREREILQRWAGTNGLQVAM